MWLLLITPTVFTFCAPAPSEFETKALCDEAKSFYVANNANGLKYKCQARTKGASEKK